MKVLHMPYNIASLISNSVRCLKSIGVEARGISYTRHAITSSDEIIVLDDYYSDGFLKKTVKQLHYSFIFNKYIRWADMIHYYWNADVLPFNIEFKLIKNYKKPAVIEWLGSEIRIPEVEYKDNPYYEAMMKMHQAKGDFSSYENSDRTQRKFFEQGFNVITSPGMDKYLLPQYYTPPFYYLRQRIYLEEFQPVFPDKEKSRPLIVHTTTAPIAKGTPYVIEALEHLKLKYDFDFKVVENMKRSEAIKVVQQCDIYVDQLNLGHHGLAVVEAMALGKPVICYIKPSLRNDYPPELPIVSANPDTIKTELERLIKNPQLRHELGRQGRAYVEKYHHPKVLANEMVKIYEDVISKHRNK